MFNKRGKYLLPTENIYCSIFFGLTYNHARKKAMIEKTILVNIVCAKKVEFKQKKIVTLS